MAVNEGNIHYVEFRGDTSQLRKEIDLLSAKLNTLSKNTSVQTTSIANNTKGMTSSMSSSFMSLGRVLAGAGIVIGIQQIGRAFASMLSVTAELETTRATFRVFTGSVQTADNVLAELKSTALESPLNFQDFVQGAKTLMGYGVSVEQVTPMVKMLGDVSGGSADRFQRLSLAFGQVVGAGRLMGQETRQMINAGFNPLQFIAEKTGRSMSELQDTMRKGGISVQEVADAFATATSEGGRFYGLSQEITNTLGGQFNKLKESLYFLGAELGQEFVKSFDIMGLVKGIGDAFEQIKPTIINVFQTISNSQIFETFTKLIGLLPSLINLLIQVGGTLFAIADYFAELVVSGVDSFFGIFADNTADANKELDKMNDNVKKLIPEINTLSENELVKRVFNIDSLKQNQKDALNVIEQGRIDMTKFTLGIKQPAKQEEKAVPQFDTKPPGGDEEGKEYAREFIQGYSMALREGGSLLKEYTSQIIKPALDAFDKLNKYIQDSTTATLRNAFGKRGQLVLDEQNKFKELRRLAMVYGLDYELITKAYEQNVLNISNNFREKNLQDAKSHANSLIGIVKNQVKAQSDLMMKLSGVSASANLGELIRETDANKFENYVNSIHSAVSDFYAQTPAMFGQALGEMVAQGADFNQIMDNFGQLLMGQFGKLLQQLGQSLIVLGTSSLVFQKSIEEMFKPGNPAAGVAAVAAGVALVAAGGALSKMSQATGGQDNGSKALGGSIGRTRSMTSGNTYQYGGGSYATQSIKLSIDLTGSITASPTGYNISKQYETIARVTGK